MRTIDQRAAVNRPSTTLPQRLGEAERAALAGHPQVSRSPDLDHHRRSVEAHLQPHACERLSSFEQQLIQQSPTERELSNLISGQPAEAI